ISDSKSEELRTIFRCHQTSASGFQIPNSRFQISDSKSEELRTIFRCHQTSASGFQIPNSKFQISDSRSQELPSDFHHLNFLGIVGSQSVLRVGSRRNI